MAAFPVPRGAHRAADKAVMPPESERLGVSVFSLLKKSPNGYKLTAQFMNDCIFCKIIAGSVPNHTVYEDSEVLAFLDIFPHARGHTVVVPKRHIETIFDINAAEVVGLMAGVQKAMERIQSVLAPDGFNAGWNQSKAGGQIVSHLHVHILPRWHGDGGTSMHGIIKNPGDMPVSEVAKLFI